MVRNPVLKISVFQAGFLFILFVLFHGSVVFFERGLCLDSAQGKSFEDLSFKPGDSEYYRNSILSLLKYRVRDRFVTFQSAQIPQPNIFIPENAFTGWKETYAALYPYPPVKPGFAWTGALFSFFLPSSLLERGIPRVMAVNLLLSLICLSLLFVLGVQLFESTAIATLICTLYLTDVTVLHTNYHSQSHTMAGMFWFLCGLLLFFRKAKDSFLIGLCLAMVVQTSPHFIPWSIAFCFLFLFHRRPKEWFWFVAGFAIPGLYLLSVDGILELRAHGIHGYLDHLLFMKRTSQGVMGAIPFFSRWMWDLRALQPKAIYLIGLLGVSLVIWRKKTAFSFWEKKHWMLLEIFFIGAFLSFFTSLPMIRVMLPFMVFVAVWGGMALGGLWQTQERLARIAVVTILFLWSGSTFFAFDWVSDTPNLKPTNTLSLEDRSSMLLNQAAYYAHLRSRATRAFHSPVNFKYWTKSLDEFVSQVEIASIAKGDLFIELRPTYLVDAYAATNRFYAHFINQPWHPVSGEEIQRDFRLYNELMLAKNSGLLYPGEVIESWREKWELGNWDHETGYWLKFKNGFRPFVQGLPLEQMDMRKIYYFKFSALKRIVEERRLHPLS